MERRRNAFVAVVQQIVGQIAGVDKRRLRVVRQEEREAVGGVVRRRQARRLEVRAVLEPVRDRVINGPARIVEVAKRTVALALRGVVVRVGQVRPHRAETERRARAATIRNQVRRRGVRPERERNPQRGAAHSVRLRERINIGIAEHFRRDLRVLRLHRREAADAGSGVNRTIQARRNERKRFVERVDGGVRVGAVARRGVAQVGDEAFQVVAQLDAEVPVVPNFIIVLVARVVVSGHIVVIEPIAAVPGVGRDQTGVLVERRGRVRDHLFEDERRGAGDDVVPNRFRVGVIDVIRVAERHHAAGAFEVILNIAPRVILHVRRQNGVTAIRKDRDIRFELNRRVFARAGRNAAIVVGDIVLFPVAVHIFEDAERADRVALVVRADQDVAQRGVNVFLGGRREVAFGFRGVLRRVGHIRRNRHKR